MNERRISWSSAAEPKHWSSAWQCRAEAVTSQSDPLIFYLIYWCCLSLSLLNAAHTLMHTHMREHSHSPTLTVCSFTTSRKFFLIEKFASQQSLDLLTSICFGNFYQSVTHCQLQAWLFQSEEFDNCLHKTIFYLILPSWWPRPLAIFFGTNFSFD